MKRFLSLAILCTMLAIPAIAAAQAMDLDIWVDTDGDGMPGPATGNEVGVGMNTSFDLWTDGKSFAQWTNYNIFFEVGNSPSERFWSMDTMNVDVTYHQAGTTFPVDNFNHPYALGIGGFGFADLRGIKRIATVTLISTQMSTLDQACIRPIIDYQDTYGFYTTFGGGPAYGLFDTRTNGCYTVTGNATENTSWGSVKALFR